MNENKILHVMILDKFLAPYIDFVDKNFGRENHHYLFITSEKYDYGLTPEHKVEFLYTDDDIFITLLDYMKMAKKIILHGLWRDKVDILLYFNQELLKKCCWVMWGGDFYFPETKSKIRHEVIRKMKSYIVSNRNDIEYIKKNYSATIENLYHSQLYPTCISYIEENLDISSNANIIKIQVGNSATPTNKHEEIFRILENYKDKDIEILTILSYGEEKYKNQIVNLGREIFGDKFKPIVDFMDFNTYKKFLQQIDIAVFNNNRQQAGSNIKLLAGYGKKLYISKENSFYHELKNDGIVICDIDKFNIELLDKESLENNKKLALKFYSIDALLNSWKEIFDLK